MAQPVGLEELPVVEAWAIAQAEPGHEVVAVERHRIGQWGDTVRAYLRRRVAVRPAFGHAFGEALQVEPARRLSAETDSLAIDIEPGAAQRFVEGGKCAPQRAARARLIMFRPQQRGQRITAMSLACRGKVGEQRDRFAGIDLDRRAVALDPWRAE